MSVSSDTVPVVLVMGGLDPTGGAGLQADVESILSMGCHPAPVATAITIQDTESVKSLTPVSPMDVIAQARAVLEDMPVAAFKIGLVGSVQNAEAMHTIVQDYPQLPVVFDPVCRLRPEYSPNEELLTAFVSLLCPLTTLLTLSSADARLLAPEADSLNATAQQLMSYGCQYVLVTGAAEPTATVTNTLFGNMDHIESFTWERLPGRYHGAGCTLASASAALLAHRLDPVTSCNEAQQYTFEALRAARRMGHGGLLPTRLYWAHEEPERDK